MRLHFIDECRQSGDRGSLYRCAGMAAVAPCGKFHIRLAFFKYSHHGKITVDSTDGLRDDTTALITYQEQFNPPALQLRYDLRCTVPTPLFRTGTCQIDISVRSPLPTILPLPGKMPSQSIWYRTRLAPIPFLPQYLRKKVHGSTHPPPALRPDGS